MDCNKTAWSIGKLAAFLRCLVLFSSPARDWRINFSKKTRDVFVILEWTRSHLNFWWNYDREVSHKNNFFKASYGASIGWLSAVLTLLKGQNSPLSSGPISIEGFFPPLRFLSPNQINDQLWLIKFQSLPTLARRAASAVSSPRASTDGWELLNTSNFITLTTPIDFRLMVRSQRRLAERRPSSASPCRRCWVGLPSISPPRRCGW